MTSHGHFHWNELMTRDVEAAKKFYAETIGWTFEGMEMPDGMYWIAMGGETPLGGIFEMKGPDFEGVPAHWLAYLSVDDVDARLAKAKAADACRAERRGCSSKRRADKPGAVGIEHSRL